jgi:hypothetical protein
VRIDVTGSAQTPRRSCPLVQGWRRHVHFGSSVSNASLVVTDSARDLPQSVSLPCRPSHTTPPPVVQTTCRYVRRRTSPPANTDGEGNNGTERCLTASWLPRQSIPLAPIPLPIKSRCHQFHCHQFPCCHCPAEEEGKGIGGKGIGKQGIKE